MTSPKSLRYRWLPLLLLLLSLLAGAKSAVIVQLPWMSGIPDVELIWIRITQTVAWLAGAAVFIQLLRWLLFDRIVARAIGGPVPGVLREIASVIVYLTAITCIVGFAFDRSVTGFLAALGAGGVVIGFALRNLFADVFTGLAINMDRTFVIGDWVQINEGLAEPTIAQIREIGWRCTSLTTEEQTTVVVPNGMLGQERLINLSQPIAPTRFEVKLAVEYSVPSARVKRVLIAALEALRTTPGFCLDRKPVVLLGKASDIGVEYVLRYWITPWNPISPTSAMDLVLSRALEHLRLAGISLAYPKTDVYHAQMPERQVDGHTLAGEIQLLSNIDLFHPLDTAEIERLAASLQRRVVRSGRALVRLDEEGDTLFVLIEGLLDVEVMKDGTMQSIAHVEPGQFIGEMSLLTGARRSATVRAVTESVVYELGKDPLVEIMHERPELAEQLSRILAQRQMQTRQALESPDDQDTQEALDNFARQLLGRMREFLLSARLYSMK